MAKRRRDPDPSVPPEESSHDEGEPVSSPIPEPTPPTTLTEDSLPVMEEETPTPTPTPTPAPPPQSLAAFPPHSLPRTPIMAPSQMIRAPAFRPVAVGTRVIQRAPSAQARMIRDRASHAYFKRIFSQMRALGKIR